MASYFETTEMSYKDKSFKPNDTVKMYTESKSIVYPAILLTAEELQMYRVKAMKGVVLQKPTNATSIFYSVYIVAQDQAIKIGVIEDKDIGSVLKSAIFKPFGKKVYLDESTCLEGDMLFALCPPSMI